MNGRPRSSSRRIIGWRLDRQQRDLLLEKFPARYSRVVADHVTLRADAGHQPLPPSPQAARIVGRSDDGRGVEALVVEMEGTTDRPGGGVYHITWSLAPGRRAVESNAVIAQRGWSVMPPAELLLAPAELGGGSQG